MAADDALCNAFLSDHPVEAARVLETIPARDLGVALAKLDPGSAANALERMDARLVAECLAHTKPRTAGAILNRLPLDFAVVALRAIEPKRRDSIISSLETKSAEQWKRLVRLPEDTVAGLAESHVTTLPEDISAGEARRRIRATPTITDSDIWVVDRGGRLVGAVSLHELYRAPRDELVSSIARHDVPRLQGSTPRRDLVTDATWEGASAVPVVDEDELFLGVVGYKTIQRLRSELERDRADDAMQTVLALGELYWMGLAGVVEGLARRDPDKGGAKDG